MKRDSSKFISLNHIQVGEVILNYDITCEVVDIGKVGISNSCHINNVRIIEGFKQNLLGISELCGKGYIVFGSSHCYVQGIFNNKISFVTQRKDNTYAFP